MSLQGKSRQHARDGRVDLSRHPVGIVEHVFDALLSPAAPDHSVRAGINDVEHQRACLVLPHLRLTGLVAVAIFAVDPVDPVDLVGLPRVDPACKSGTTGASTLRLDRLDRPLSPAV